MKEDPGVEGEKTKGDEAVAGAGAVAVTKAEAVAVTEAAAETRVAIATRAEVAAATGAVATGTAAATEVAVETDVDEIKGSEGRELGPGPEVNADVPETGAVPPSHTHRRRKAVEEAGRKRKSRRRAPGETRVPTTPS